MKKAHKETKLPTGPGKTEVAAMEKAKSVNVLATGKYAQAGKKRGRYK
ncbi:MAG TPA: hypothetical protein VHQ92_01010 [Pseudolabrys sp.]|nr:hypothetical protein [Pseudolabrys sp.]